MQEYINIPWGPKL